MRYRISYDDPGLLEVDLEFDGLIPPNPHPVGVAPFWKGTHFDQPGHVTGWIVLRGERIAVDCYSTRDRSWGPRPMGPPKRRGDGGAAPRPTAPRGIGYSFGASGPADAWLVYSSPGPAGDPVDCGFLLRGGRYGHILSGERRVRIDGATGWPTTIEIEAVDDLGRPLAVEGTAVSRHWKGHGGDTLMRWEWDGQHGWGEDQTYLGRALWELYRDRAAGDGK